MSSESIECKIGDIVRVWNSDKDYYVVRAKRGNGPDKDAIYLTEDGKFEEYRYNIQYIKLVYVSENSEKPEYKVGDIIVYFKYKTEKIGRIKSIFGTYILIDDYKSDDYDNDTDGIDIKNIYRLATSRECVWFSHKWNHDIDNDIKYHLDEITELNKKIEQLLKNKIIIEEKK